MKTLTNDDISTIKTPNRKNASSMMVPGQKTGRLTVLARAGNSGSNAVWNCICDCGKTCIVTKNAKSCGCLQAERVIVVNTTHGMTDSPTHKSWHSMIDRCTLPSHKSYNSYGGRGIVVCDRWRKFENFFADMGKRPFGKTLDRIDVNGNYELVNCRWATHREQSENRRPKQCITHNGETLTIAKWSTITGLSPQLIRWRIKSGWLPDVALTKASRQFGNMNGI